MSMEVSLHVVFFRCVVVGETQVSAEGKDKLAIIKEDLFTLSSGSCALSLYG